jgi:Large ribosomal RNA subunit accumulation protein YceD
MREHRSEKFPSAPWHVAVAAEDVAETGKSFDLVADAATRAAVARVAGLRDLPRLQAHFSVTPQGADGLHVTGRVSATVSQTCVVTLEPLSNEVDEEVDLLFAPRPATVEHEDDGTKPHRDEWKEPERLIDGRVDLGALAVEFLVLGVDPYPRKPGAVFQPPPEATPDEGPFAALGALKKDQDGP